MLPLCHPLKARQHDYDCAESHYRELKQLDLRPQQHGVKHRAQVDALRRHYCGNMTRQLQSNAPSSTPVCKLFCNAESSQPPIPMMPVLTTDSWQYTVRRRRARHENRVPSNFANDLEYGRDDMVSCFSLLLTISLLRLTLTI